MKFTLPEDNAAGIGIDGKWFPAADGVVDLPDVIVADYGVEITAHGLTPYSEPKPRSRAAKEP